MKELEYKSEDKGDSSFEVINRELSGAPIPEDLDDVGKTEHDAVREFAVPFTISPSDSPDNDIVISIDHAKLKEYKITFVDGSDVVLGQSYSIHDERLCLTESPEGSFSVKFKLHALFVGGTHTNDISYTIGKASL